MGPNFKKALLFSTALIAVSFTGTEAAHAAVQNIGAGTTAVTGPTSDGINFTADGIATVAGGVNISGAPGTIVTAAGANTGTVEFAGTSSVIGAVGSGTAIKALAINGAGAAVSFSGTVNSQQLTFSSNGQAVFGNTTTITNAIALGTGTIRIDNNTFTATGGISGGTGTVSITGSGTALAGGTAALATLNKSNGGSATVSSQVNTTSLNVTGGTLVVSNAGSTVTGTAAIGANTLQFQGASLSIVTSTGGGGTLTLDRAGAQAVTGAIGATGNVLTALNLGGSGTKTLSGAIYATNTNVGAVTANSAASINGNVVFTADGTVGLGDTANITGTVTANTPSHGTINFAGTSAVDGAVGTGNAIKTLNVNGDNTKTVTFGSTVNAGELAFSSSGNAVLNGASTITTITKNHASTSTIGGTGALAATTVNVNAGTLDWNGATSTISGTTTIANGATLQFEGASLATVAGTGGNLTLNGTTQSVGQIGSGGNVMGTVTLTGGAKTLTGTVHATTTDIAAITVTAQNAAITSDINFSADGTLNLANNSTVTGNITNGTAGHGTLSNTGTLHITGNMARLKSFTVAGTTTVDGNATAADAMDVGIQTMNVGGTFTTTANTALTYRVNTPTTSGKVVATGEATVHADTAVNMIVDTNVYVSQGQEFILIDGAESGGHVATLTDGKLTTTNTALLHFRQKTTDTNNLVVYADRTQMSTAASNPNSGAVGTMLDALATNGDADIDALQIRLANLTTNAEVEAVLATLVPNVSGGSIVSTVAVGNTTGSITNARIASLGDGEYYGSGMAAGNGEASKHFWAQAFGATSDQGMRDRIAGYEADSYGFVVGLDTDITEEFTVGLALSYGDTDVAGEDANRTATQVDSYGISLYGGYDFDEALFLTGQLGYMYNDIDTTRYNIGGIVGNTGRADFNSDQYSARAELGRDYAVGHGITLTPSGLVNYNYIDVENFTERGAGGLSLRNVDTDEMQILEFGLNLKGEVSYEDNDGGTIKPNIHGGVRHDVIGDSVATTGFLAGGGAAFQTNGADPAQTTVNIGTGITWETSGGFDFTANYDYEHKSDYDSHSGFVRAGYKF